MDEIDELIEMAADARKRLVDAQREYDEIKRRIGKRADEAKQVKAEEPAATTPHDPHATQPAVVETPHQLRFAAQMAKYHGAFVTVIPQHAFAHEAGLNWRNVALIHRLNELLKVPNGRRTGRGPVRLAAIVALWSRKQHLDIVARFRWLEACRQSDPAMTVALQNLAVMCGGKSKDPRRNRLIYLRAIDALLDEDHGAAALTRDTIPVDHPHLHVLAAFSQAMATQG